MQKKFFCYYLFKKKLKILKNSLLKKFFYSFSFGVLRAEQHSW